MLYQIESQGDGYNWRCLGQYVNPGFGKPIIQTIKWTVAKEGGNVRIAVLLPLTGDLAHDGQEMLSILRYAAEHFNQYAESCGSDLHLELVVEDTAGDPDKAAAVIKKTLSQGIKNIIGLISSSELAEVKPLVDAAGAIVISPTSSAPSLSTKDRIYRLVLNDAAQTKALAKLMQQDGKKNVVVLYRDDTYGQDLVKSFQSNFQGKVTPLAYNPAHPDFSALLQQAGQTVQKGISSETAVLAVSYDEIVTVLKDIPADSTLLRVRWYGSDGSALSHALQADQETAAKAAQLSYTAPDYTPYGDYFTPLYAVLNNKLQPAEPSKESSVSVFDGLWLLGCAYLEKGTSADIQEINSYVGKHAFCGLSGVLALDENGDRRFGYYKFYQLYTVIFTSVNKTIIESQKCKKKN
ncbi:penicillin-binding protein activator [Desulfosporosinus sp. FKB]|uniref:ABC transporter substrate-binding protein n=1 Tax=Desulfosporosinus sp. FKB TaxID=1969835 RepID=UPI0014820520|nr:penicillin-binding protein activator [Desulfosporosinus sp. FKB]